MSQVQAKQRPDLIRWAMAGLVLLGAAAVLYVIGAASFKPKQAADLSAYRTGTLEKLEIAKAPAPGPDVAFTDAGGKSLTLKDFKGQVVVMNLWATWCAPCKEEMPTLAKLQAAYAVQPVSVLPISVDRDSDLNLAVDQIAATPPLKLYRDPGYKMAFGLNPRAKGFPTTVIFDRHGRERARLSGSANWASPEAKALIEQLLREG